MSTIPSKYLLKDGVTPAENSLGLKCSVCGAQFVIPPEEITADIAAATICEICAAAADSAAIAAAKPDLEHTSTL